MPISADSKEKLNALVEALASSPELVALAQGLEAYSEFSLKKIVADLRTIIFSRPNGRQETINFLNILKADEKLSQEEFIQFLVVEALANRMDGSKEDPEGFFRAVDLAQQAWSYAEEENEKEHKPELVLKSLQTLIDALRVLCDREIYESSIREETIQKIMSLVNQGLRLIDSLPENEQKSPSVIKFYTEAGLAQMLRFDKQGRAVADLEAALKHYDKALAIASQILVDHPDDKEAASAYRRALQVKTDAILRTKDPDRLAPQLTETIQLSIDFEDAGEIRNAAGASYTAGRIAAIMGDTEQAKRHYLRALKLAAQINDQEIPKLVHKASPDLKDSEQDSENKS